MKLYSHTALIKSRFGSIVICFLMTFSNGFSDHSVEPSKIIGIECKSGKEDQGILYFEDMSLGVPARDLVERLKEMQVNNIRIPIMNKLRPDGRADVIVNFLKSIKNQGGEDIKVILSVRRYGLHAEKQQIAWCVDVAYIFNALKKVRLDGMVVGCSFDENDNLRDEQSSKGMWDKRHRGILESLDRLNKMTGDAFMSRTVFIHGKGMGSQFRGVKASSDSMNFPNELKRRAANYCYNFKFFQTGFPKDLSVSGWEKHFNEYCGFSEVKDLGVQMLFVGDSGDGIRRGGFTPETTIYGKCGPHVMHALSNVFSQNRWTGFSFGVMMSDPKSAGKTALHVVNKERLIERPAELECWNTWVSNLKVGGLLKRDFTGYIKLDL